MSSSIEDRNTESVKQSLRDMEARLLHFQNRLVGLELSLRTAMNRMASLERLVVEHKVVITSHGPTVK